MWFVLLATILDLYSKRLIAWEFGKKMTVDLVEGELDNVITIRGLNNLLIFYSNKGK